MVSFVAFPIGETKPCCKVFEIISRKSFVVVLVECEGEPETMYMRLFKPDEVGGISVGDRGRMVMTKGGPFGAYWEFEPEQNMPSGADKNDRS